jgi:hypothetical protein
VHSTKSATVQELRHEIEQSCAAIPADTLANVFRSVALRCNSACKLTVVICDSYPCAEVYCYSAHKISTRSELCNG